MHGYIHVNIIYFCVTMQEEKAVLKAKAEKDAELQARASISIPLVDEKREDVKRAKSTAFATGSSVTERKRKRREIKSQSVFGDVSSPQTKTARHTLLKAAGVCVEGSVFGRGGGRTHGRVGSSASSSSSSSSSSVIDRRNSLGIRTTDRSSSS